MIDSNAGQIDGPVPYQTDMLPADLIPRAMGRLEKNCTLSELGLVAAYIDIKRRGGMLMPAGRQLVRNPATNIKTLESIAHFYNSNWNRFLDTPAVNP